MISLRGQQITFDPYTNDKPKSPTKLGGGILFLLLLNEEFFRRRVDLQEEYRHRHAVLKLDTESEDAKTLLVRL